MFHVSRLPLLVVSFAAFCGLSSAALAEKPAYLAPQQGTAGTAPLALVIENRTGATLNCIAALAHWFSDDLGTASPGTTLAFDLRHDPASGTISRMNDAGDRMPVEAIFCSADEQRARIALPIQAGAVPAELRFVCGGKPMVCEGV